MADDTMTLPEAPATLRSPDTVPYSWPWDGAFRPGRFVLLVAGAQQGMAQASLRATAVLTGIDQLAATVRSSGGLVCWVRHASIARDLARRHDAVLGTPHRRGGLLPVPGSAEWQWCVDPDPADVVVDAGGFDGFHDGPLDRVLRSLGSDLVGMCGLAHEVAVDSTCRSANDRGYECLTLTDLVAPIDPDTSAHALSSVTMSGGIFGAIAPAAALVDLFTRAARWNGSSPTSESPTSENPTFEEVPT
ncbi:MAG TPA: isochorismatase family cysteine hydrolase [Microthrixaceae bacterium]|nr:isochorismatase family cysteine hydrolase [Microthrixaceae bacterium]